MTATITEPDVEYAYDDDIELWLPPERITGIGESVAGIMDDVRSKAGEFSPNLGNVSLGEGSEAELRADEKVCPQTGYVYYAGLDTSPHIDSQGRVTW